VPDLNDGMLKCLVGPSTARTLDPTGWTVRQQFRSLVGREPTEQAKLFEMHLTADNRDRKGVDQQKRDGITSSSVQRSLTIRTRWAWPDWPAV